MAFSRTWVIVRGATARSAFCSERERERKTDNEQSLRLAVDRTLLLGVKSIARAPDHLITLQFQYLLTLLLGQARPRVLGRQ